jgi:hypothetical protein
VTVGNALLAEREPTVKNDSDLITVCDHCLQASCWNGIFYCEDYKRAGTTQKTRAELQALKDRYGDEWEHPSYRKTDEELMKW